MRDIHDDEHKAELKYLLARLTISRIKPLYRLFYPQGDANRGREELAAIVFKALCFENQVAFDAWFATLSDTERIVIGKLVFYKALPVAMLERETEQQMTVSEKQPFRTYIKLDPILNLKFLTLLESNDVLIVEIPEVMQVAFKPFLKPPAYDEDHEYRELGGTGGLPGGESAVFQNTENFSGIFGLLYEALTGKNALPSESMFNPFKFTKKETEALYGESGFPRFPACDFPAPDPLRLAAAFIGCQHNVLAASKHVLVSRDGGDRAYALIRQFFYPVRPEQSGYYYYAGSYFEGLLTGVYLKRRGPSGFESVQEQPLLRQIFLNFLTSIADRESPVMMDEAFSWVLARGVFLFSNIKLDNCFRFKAASVTIGGITRRSYESEIIPSADLVFELITKPLFRAYCFVFGALGCLELTVSRPPYVAVLNGKEIPVSPYDCLRAIRLTEFGKWCLGITETRPEEASQEFEIIADPALFYVTLRGESIERRVFLDKIGNKMGNDRWTINAASFLNGCTGKTGIRERIKKFRDLVDRYPAEHWTAFFAQLERNAGLFEERTGDFLVYQMPQEKEARIALMGDNEFRRVARFAEDNLILVEKGNRPKFLSVLASRGISVFATPHR